MLDTDQQKVVNNTEGYYAVHAGPGSGKSTTLLHRAASLTGKILCVTFTSEAAKNLRTRAGKEFAHMDTSCFSTLHSLALKFAYEHPEAFPFKLSSNPLAVEGTAAKAVWEATNNKINYQAFTSWVSLQKRRRVSPVESIREAEESGIKLDYALAYKKYQDALKKLGIMDFDDLIYQMVGVLESRPDIRSKWQYSYLMMDEAQDACELDWKMLQLLSGTHKNVMAVGDAGQAIYGFRGGVSDHFLDMESFFPGTKKMYLGNNYRSTRNIVKAVKGSAPYPEISEHFNAVSEEEGVTPSLDIYSTDYREAEEVVKKIKAYGPESCAVLCRTNLGLRAVEEECLNQNVQYHLLGNSGFWEAPEIQSVLAYVRCAAGPTDHAVASAIRSPFWPSKYMKKKQVLEEIKRIQDRMGGSAYASLEHLSIGQGSTASFKEFIKGLYKYRYLNPSEAISNIIKDLKAVELYKEEENINPDRNPVANLKELIRVAGKYADLNEFLDFVRRIQYVSKNKKGVCLTTIHSAKGREFENVFMISVNSGVLPHKNSESLEEERCVFYVGISRAEKTLHLSCYDTPSEFLKPFTEIKHA